MTLLGFVIGVLAIGILYWCVQRLIQAYKIPDPIATTIIVVFALLVVIWLIGLTTGKAPVWWPLR
jgi:predicted PurR-regulated permease PerM